jgi:ribosome-binding factor A
MPSRKRKKDDPRALCAHLYPDDGVNPREDVRQDALDGRKPDRKTRQLCKQVAQTLQLALGGLPEADVLVGVSVWDVTPAPHAGRLRVVMAVSEAGRAAEVAALLRQRGAWLRGEVAAAITRRRVPELTFDVIVRGGGRD